MAGQVILIVMRGVILVGMATAFAISLATSVLNDQRLSLVSSEHEGRDPGVRVLLADRRTYDQRTDILPYHERVTIAVLRSCWLVSPDQPDDPQYALKIERGEQIAIKPDVDGLVFSSSTWGEEQRWPVPRLRLVTQNPSIQMDPPELPGKWRMGRFEDAEQDAVFAIGSRRYRGSVDVTFVSSKQLQVVNVLPIEAYVEGVIAIEMKSSYPIEALKAQAIASRSYAYAKAWQATQAKRTYDITDAMDDQDYHGHGLGGEFTRQAVRETTGQVLVTPRLRLPFVPQFCAANGGWTEAIEAVFPGSRDVSSRESVADIMRVERDPFCEKGALALGYTSSHWEQRLVLRPEDLQQRLQTWMKDSGRNDTIGYVTDLTIGQREPTSGRIRSVVVSYTPLKRLEIPAHEFRRMMGPHIVRSMLWTSLDSQLRSGERRVKDWIITMRGYGHGVGMSQISAWAMAKEGFTAQQVLQFFYPGAELKVW